MLTRLIILLCILTSCQRGLIPCPGGEPFNFKHRSSYKTRPVLTAEVSEQPNTKIPNERNPKPNDRFINNVSVEEWDCPKPGKRKYMPRAVKQNIRKNWKKINATDSLHSAASPNK